MANGRRGSRGRGQRSKGTGATGGASGFPANAQGNRTSLAQSGGKDSTFGGGKGGGTWSGPGAGGRNNRKVGTGVLNNGTPYNVRSPGGDNTIVKGAHGGAGKLNLPGGADFKGNKGKTNKSIVKPHELAPKGFGGGY
jgi:hypothetical protein